MDLLTPWKDRDYHISGGVEGHAIASTMYQSGPSV
jgi:hypothetical protein